MNNKIKTFGRHVLSSFNSNFVTAVDLFCGAGGLTRGLIDAGIRVVAGYDIDSSCRYPYEKNNNGALFKLKSVTELSAEELASNYPSNHIRVLVGCAPCQPFSKYTQGIDNRHDTKWSLLQEFTRLTDSIMPDIISMENVPEIKRYNIFKAFVISLEKAGYQVSHEEAFCPEFGIPQQRKRLVLLASRLGSISLQKPQNVTSYSTVRQAIAHLPKLRAGDIDPHDIMHRTSRLSPLNLRRIKASRPGGYWREWPKELIAKCHQEKSGITYPSVYGRMEWDRPSPTITTQFFGFGNGRFGHPEQDRALSLREGAILQSFPENYEFAPHETSISFSTQGRLIGNAVPVLLGQAIGESIMRHLNSIA
jgi:DNA (cytosine-5)-methyltransferase 1